LNKKASSYAEKGGRLTIYIDLTGEDGSRRSLSGLKSACNRVETAPRGKSRSKKMAAIPFDQRDGFIWLDGKFVDWKDAKVHVLTHGLHYASAVFEGERAYGGEIFKLNEHTERLHESARILGFEIPFSVAEINDACRELLEKQGFEDAYVRPIAWRGSDSLGVSAQNNRIHLAIAIWQWPSYFSPEEKMKGI